MTTYNQTVATDVCGDAPSTIPVNIDCSLCAIGFPQAGGMIGISFYGPRCIPTADPSPSYWLGFNTKYAQWKCPNPGSEVELNPNLWVATGFFNGAVKDGCSNSYKFDATLTATGPNTVSITVSVKVLVQTISGWQWQSYISWSETLNEIVNADTTRYRGRNFSSPYFVSVSPAIAGGLGDPVSFVKTTIGTQSMRLGCGSTGYALPPCGFWDGTQWLTCLRGVIRSSGNYNVREFSQLGFNTAGCGGVSSGGYCFCDTINLTSVSPILGNTTYNADPQFVTDYGIVGLPGGIETIGADQQIQISGGSPSGIKLIVKQVNGGSIYICTNDNGAGWVNSVAVVAQNRGPRILTATRSGFDVWLYALNFPNENILPNDCSSGGSYPSASGSDPYWCTPSGCVQSPLQPSLAYGGPYASSGSCASACAGLVPPAPPYWCVSGTCVSSSTPPGSYSAGPFTTLALCQASGCEGGGGGGGGEGGFMSLPPTQEYQPAFGEDVEKPRLPLEIIQTRISTPCIHRGEALENPESCGCNKLALLYKCDKGGTCRVYGMPRADGEKECLNCNEYKQNV